MTTTCKLSSARETLLATLPEDISLSGQASEPRFTHVPASHAKALHPDAQVVVGMRGAGKSFWWAALQKEQHRRLVAGRSGRLRLIERADVRVGFGEVPAPDRYPARDVLKALLEAGHSPRIVWRTVVLHALSDGAPELLGDGSDWTEKVNRVARRPEPVERFLYNRDQELDREDRYAIVLFDALDRSASDWETMNNLIRGLLETVLDFRPYQRLRVKCFLRSDQLDERQVADFPDASKVLAAKVELSWPPEELYAMLFQYLGNSQDGSFRLEIEKMFKLEWKEVDGIWVPPDSLGGDEKVQRKVFHAIAGPWMGKDRRRGFPYTWVPGHLADAHGRTSPRSFLAALRKAAEDSRSRYPQHEWPLHYESIKRGVQQASSIRRRELQEDYPWVNAVLEPLQGRVVPCTFGEIEDAWQNGGVIDQLRNRAERGQERLPPAHLSDGPAGLRQDLEELGIFLPMRDGRVNIPDVFRVAYGLGRRGGVRPLRRGEA